MRRAILALAIFCGLSTAAFAACPSPVTGKDATGTSQNFGTVVDGSGNCWGGNAIVDGTAAANKAAVDSSGGLSVKGEGTAGTPAGGVLSIQGVSSGQAVSISGAVSQTGGPWTSNVTQFGSSNVVTGTGASGSGIPRVTVSNDSQIANTNFGSYDSGAVTGTGTVNSSSHAAGTSVGGLITVAVAHTNSGSGVITNFSWTSIGGSTGTLVFRVWQKNPSSTTCTDNTAFASNSTDDKQLITPPFALTPQAPAVTTGDSKTYAGLQQVSWDYANQSSNQNLYVCAVTVATDTADESTSPVVSLSGPQN